MYEAVCGQSKWNSWCNKFVEASSTPIHQFILEAAKPSKTMNKLIHYGLFAQHISLWSCLQVVLEQITRSIFLVRVIKQVLNTETSCLTVCKTKQGCHLSDVIERHFFFLSSPEWKWMRSFQGTNWHWLMCWINANISTLKSNIQHLHLFIWCRWTECIEKEKKRKHNFCTSNI